MISMLLFSGVPQESVRGPFVFSIYSEPIYDIAWKHCVKIHLYAVVFVT